MSDLPALLERIKNATGPDREVDAAIFDAFPDERWPRCAYLEENCVTLRSFGRNPQFHDGWLTRLRANMEDKYPEDLPRLTASLDAALALCERKLPGWSWWVGNADTREDDPYDRRVTPRAILKRGETTSLSVHEKRWFDGHAATPALALLSALVSALASAEEAPLHRGKDETP